MNKPQPQSLGAMMKRRQWLQSAAGIATCAALPAWAQGRSSASGRLVVPFAPGGGNDVFARQLSHGLSEAFGYNMIVENKPGAGGNLGTEMVVRASPQSDTYLLGHTGTVSINPALYKGLKFNPTTDLQPVAMFASSALLLVVPASSPIRNVAELVKVLREKGEAMNYASSGSGSGGHLAGEMLAFMLGVKATHVPYKGTAPSLNDVAGGLVDFSFSVIPAAQALVKSGKLRALAVTSLQRHAQLPDVPTVAESGVEALAKFESTLTYGVLAPKGAAANTVKKLSDEILQVAAQSAFQSKLGVEGAVPLLGDAKAYAKKIQEETRKWDAVIKASGASV